MCGQVVPLGPEQVLQHHPQPPGVVPREPDDESDSEILFNNELGAWFVGHVVLYPRFTTSSLRL